MTVISSGKSYIAGIIKLSFLINFVKESCMQYGRGVIFKSIGSNLLFKPINNVKGEE
jgi:hypothetical protein